MLEVSVRAKGRDRIVERLREQRAAMDTDSPAMRLALMRAGMLMEAQIKIEIRKQRLVDTGRLLNSIKWETYKPAEGGVGIRVGSFGVPYAAVWEFGLQNYQEDVRPHTRVISEAFGRSISPVVVNVAGFSRIRNVSARPYIRPALQLQKARIASLLAQAVAAKA